MALITTNKLPEFCKPELLFKLDAPLALVGLKPSTLMGKKNWDILRKEHVYPKHDFVCEFCGETETTKKKWVFRSWDGMDCHEEYKINWEIGQVEIAGYMGVCRRCHAFKHIRRNILMDRTRATYRIWEILAHGIKVANDNSIPVRWEEVPEHNIQFRDWFLRFEGIDYSSNFDSTGDFIDREIRNKQLKMLQKGYW